MAEVRYGPNGESLVPGTPAYAKGSTVKPTTSSGLPSSGLPTFQSAVPGITLPGLPAGRFASPDEAKSWFTFAKTRSGIEKKTYDGFIADLAAKGIPKSKAQAVWNDAVNWTQTLGSTSGRPLDYLAVLDPADYKGGAGGSEYGTKKQTQKQVTEYSKSGASQQIRDTMKQELGREATAEETALYTKAVNAAAKKEPSTYTGVTTTTAGGSSTTSTQSTGFDPTLFAQNFARSIPNYAETFAAKDFVSLIDQVLTDPNRIGQVVE